MTPSFSLHPTAISSGPESGFYFDPYAFVPIIRAAETNGISSVIVDDAGGLLPNLEISATLGRKTQGMTVFATHWAGVVQPVIAARQLAHLDRVIGGRLGLRILTGGGNADIAHEAACRRADEYLTLLKRLWSNAEPFDHEGEFFSVRNGFVPDKGVQDWTLPIRMTGRTATSLRTAARHATVFETTFGAPADVAALIGPVRQAAIDYGRRGALRFALIVPEQSTLRALLSGGSVAAADALRPYLDIGITEFMICGPTTPDLTALAIATPAAMAWSPANGRSSARSSSRLN